MARRTLDQTRQLLLDIGLGLLQERGVYVGVTHIRLSDVAAAAELTTGAAYRCWPNQAAFHRDLAVAAVGWRDDAPIGQTVARIRELVDARAPLPDVIREAAEANLFHYPEDAVLLNTIALRTCGPSDPTLAEAGRQRFATAIDSYASLWALLMKVYRLRPRPPFTLAHVTLSLAALSEGFAVQAMTGDPHPRVARSDHEPGIGADWTLLACAAEAIVEHFTEPDTSGNRSGRS